MAGIIAIPTLYVLGRERRANSHILSLTPNWEPVFVENLRNARRVALDDGSS